MEKRSVEMQKIQTKILNLITDDKKLHIKAVFKNTQTLRLTKIGLKLLSKEYDKWVVDPPALSAGNLIQLLRKMKYPYYIDRKQMVLFTEKDAFLAKLAGTQGWLDGKD